MFDPSGGGGDHSTIIEKIRDKKAYINRNDFEMFYAMF